MKQTVAQLFGIESGDAYIPMMWGGRLESPAEVAGRVWSAMQLIREHIQNEDDPRHETAAWMMLSEDGLGFSFVPDALSGMEEVALRNTEMDNGVRSGTTSIHFLLKPDAAESRAVASFSALAGEGQTNVGNTAGFSFTPDYPLGSAKEAATLFRGLLRIWQPDAGILSTMHTINEIPDLYDTYAGYLSWVSRAGFGTPPPVAAAAVEAFGDGTLLTARTWTVEGASALHEELRAAGVPALTDFPMEPQEVPAFPHG